MVETHPKSPGIKAKIIREFIQYWVIFLYLAVFFTVFAWYRRLILAEQSIPISDLWVPLIEAAIMAKVILVLGMLRLGHWLEDKPLIIPTLYKTVMFSAGIAVFGVLEHIVRGLLHDQSLAQAFRDLGSINRYEMLSRVLVKSFALIPFFAFREVGRVLGEGRLASLFLKASGRAASPEDGAKPT